jgi:Kinesin motor domain
VHISSQAETPACRDASLSSGITSAPSTTAASPASHTPVSCAGKTWTMLGPSGKLSEMAPDVKGVMPRALDDLFRALRGDRKITEWKMAISYVEVYCEVIRDLLTVDKMNRDTKGGGVDVQEIKGVMSLKGLTPTEVRNTEVRACAHACMHACMHACVRSVRKHIVHDVCRFCLPMRACLWHASRLAMLQQEPCTSSRPHFPPSRRDAPALAERR